MEVRKLLLALLDVVRGFIRAPIRSMNLLRSIPLILRGMEHAAKWSHRAEIAKASDRVTENPLEAYFDGHLEGPGIWKWRHYFTFYHRHFERFRHTNVQLCEVGIYSGGSLGMWLNYFGDEAMIHGVDLEPDCRCYESDRIRIHIGDQANRRFWRQFRSEVSDIDIVIDDGGHHFEQQITTFEELFEHLRPGGVYLVEDVVGQYNLFPAYVLGLLGNLNNFTRGDPKQLPSAFQAWVAGVHFYPYVTVIEKRLSPLEDLHAERHGTSWQPFFDKQLHQEKRP